MNEELKNKLTERFYELTKDEVMTMPRNELILNAYNAGREYGYKLGIIDKDSLVTVYKAGYNNAVEQVCEVLQEKLMVCSDIVYLLRKAMEELL